MRSIQPVVSACYNFEQNNRRETVTVVIAPIVMRESKQKHQISWACSRGRYCGCRTCVYAKGGVYEEGEMEV